MPEEINRVVTDAVSDLLFVSEDSGCRNLLKEGVPEERLHLVGNLMIDSLRQHPDRAKGQSAILDSLKLKGVSFGLLTLHRPSNVDDPDKLAELMEAIGAIEKKLPIYFPVHPRTRSQLDAIGDSLPAELHLLDPLGYIDFVCLMAASSVVLTDLGGIQEETTVLAVPCLTLRESTERPVTIDEGTNTLAGTTKQSILRA